MVQLMVACLTTCTSCMVQGVEKWPGQSAQEALAKEEFVSALPFLPPLSAKTLTQYYTFYVAFGE